MNIDALIGASIFTLRGAQQRREGRAYKQVWAPYGWRGGTKHWANPLVPVRGMNRG